MQNPSSLKKDPSDCVSKRNWSLTSPGTALTAKKNEQLLLSLGSDILF
jgi:hypothetical protein